MPPRKRPKKEQPPEQEEPTTPPPPLPALQDDEEDEDLLGLHSGGRPSAVSRFDLTVDAKKLHDNRWALSGLSVCPPWALSRSLLGLASFVLAGWEGNGGALQRPPPSFTTFN